MRSATPPSVQGSGRQAFDVWTAAALGALGPCVNDTMSPCGLYVCVYELTLLLYLVSTYVLIYIQIYA